METSNRNAQNMFILFFLGRDSHLLKKKDAPSSFHVPLLSLRLQLLTLPCYSEGRRIRKQRTTPQCPASIPLGWGASPARTAPWGSALSPPNQGSKHRFKYKCEK